MLTPRVFTITDDSGFLAIVNADRYNSFVSENWEFPQLLNHFIDEMNKNHIIIWATGSENKWTINFSEAPTNANPFREFSKTIEVTDGRLFLANYEDLTMAAQFMDEKIPATHNSSLFVQLNNGKYEITVRQLFDAENYIGDFEREVDFEIIVETGSKKVPDAISQIFWWR